MNRPAYRPAQDRQANERHAVEVGADGRRWDVMWRQVGWIGQTGAFYAIDEDPSRTEPGSFAPLWREISCNRQWVDDLTEVGARVVMLDEIDGAGV